MIWSYAGTRYSANDRAARSNGWARETTAATFVGAAESASADTLVVELVLALDDDSEIVGEALGVEDRTLGVDWTTADCVGVGSAPVLGITVCVWNQLCHSGGFVKAVPGSAKRLAQSKGRHTGNSHRVAIDHRRGWCTIRQGRHTARRSDEVRVPVDTPVHAPPDFLRDRVVLDLAPLPAVRGERGLRWGRDFAYAVEVAIGDAGGVDGAGQETGSSLRDLAVAADEAWDGVRLERRLAVDAVFTDQRVGDLGSGGDEQQRQRRRRKSAKMHGGRSLVSKRRSVHFAASALMHTV
ncbi:hypothetical protein C8R47DRAFT_1116297 [Mycena vitilis]|nr:hypothetical protein C8R47DRAFT_1116297 [Mycena vitilis]